MNRHREVIYGDRRQVLEGADVQEQLRSTVDRVVEQYVRGFARRRPDVDITMLRFANVIGPRIRTAMTDLFSMPVVPLPLGLESRRAGSSCPCQIDSHLAAGPALMASVLCRR